VAAWQGDAARAPEGNVISRGELANQLGRRGLADWVLIEREQELACVDEQTKLRRVERRVLWQVTVHFDSPAGRGSAHVTIDAVDGNPSAAVDQAVALAQSSIGPAWISRPLSAPARVNLEDGKLAQRAPIDIAKDVLAELKRPTDVSARATVLRERVNVTARQGFRTEWNATLLRCEALVSTGKHSLAVTRAARQKTGLELDVVIAQAKADLDELANAGAPPVGPCALVLRTDALLHDDVGVWHAFVTQADAVVERQGLTRYRERTPIAPGAEQLANPLTIASNGALDFGVRSAPVGDQGDAIRRFTLVDRGIAAGLGLTPREGALRGRDPNGGVRNLDVNKGDWDGAIPTATTGRIVEIRRLRSLAIDPYTGDASLDIALAIEHGKGGAKPFTGGAVRIDLIAALAKARRSAQTITRGAYRGPDAVWIDRAELIA
jgi:predicted Zn-dependent protease